MSAENVARHFADMFYVVAKRHVYRYAGPVPWGMLPVENQKVLIETFEKLLQDGVIKVGDDT